MRIKTIFAAMKTEKQIAAAAPDFDNGTPKSDFSKKQPTDGISSSADAPKDFFNL